MSRWRWRTEPDGSVVVDKGDGFERLRYDPVPEAIYRALDWSDLAERYGRKHGVPPEWIIAIIAIESGGDPAAQNKCCAGLMAIYAKLHGKTRQEMLDPEKNVDYGASLLGRSRKKGLDFVESASVHVAGATRTGQPHPSATSPWGIRPSDEAHAPYIGRAVRALNTVIDEAGERLSTRRPTDLSAVTAKAGAGSVLVPLGLGTAAGLGLATAIRRVLEK